MSTTYMNLTLPTVGTTQGPLYATELNSALTSIDAHTHAPGSGQQITPSGINISADLTFQSNNATALRSARFTSQSANLTVATDIGCLFVKSYELYYNDNAGNHVQITNGGNVAGTPGSIGSLVSPASATYSNPTFVFQSDSLTPGNLDGGSVIVREVAASAKGITIASPSALAADYQLTLPSALPAATSFMQLSSAGVITAAYAVDNASLETATGTLHVKAGGVTNAMLAGGINGSTKIAAGSITSVEIAANTIASGNMGVNSILTAAITDANVTSAKLAANLSLSGTLSIGNRFVASSQTNASTPLGIIRGSINSGAGIAIGEGFSISNPAPFVRRITFTTAFASAPVVVFSTYDGVTAAVTNATVTSTVGYFDLTDTTSSNAPTSFSFIVMGPK